MALKQVGLLTQNLMADLKKDTSNDSSFAIKYKTTNVKKLQDLRVVKGVPYKGIESLKNTGFQHSVLFDCFQKIKKAIEEDYFIILGFPSNMISSGLREIIALLCKYQIPQCIVTTAGAIEEDIIKQNIPFRVFDKEISDQALKDAGINRTQNILCPNSGYVWFQKHLYRLSQKYPSFFKTDPIEIAYRLGLNATSEDSFLYWCVKKNILVVPLNIEDGAIGDFFVVQTHQKLKANAPFPSINTNVNLYTYLKLIERKNKKTCAIICGAGSPKHFILNGLIPFGGADLTIYLNNEHWATGCNSGATIEESISWGKSSKEGSHLKVHGDFNWTFYLLATQLLKLKNAQFGI